MEEISAEDIENFETLLIQNAEFSSPEFDAVISQIISAKDNFPRFFSILFKIIYDTKREEARKQAIIYATFLVVKAWPSLSPELRQHIIQASINLYEIVDLNFLYCYTQLIISLTNIDSSNQSLIDFIRSQKTADDKGFHFKIYLTYGRTQNADFSNLEVWYSEILELLIMGLKHQDAEIKILSIKILASLLDFFPDEKEHTGEHISIIHELAMNSELLSQLDFVNFWKSMRSLCNCNAADKDFVTTFHDAILKVCALKTIPTDFKLYALRAIWHCAGDYDRPVVHNLGSITATVASEYVEQSNDLPFEFLFIYENCFNIYEHEPIYQFARQKIMEFLASEKRSDQIVALSIMKIMVRSLPHQAFSDVELIVNTIDNALRKTDDHLFIVLGCSIICSLSRLFAWNLIDFEVFLPLTIAHLVHPHPDVRFHAIQATQWAITINNTPLPGISLQIFRLLKHVSHEEILPFLILWGKAIVREENFETELVTHFANFTLAMLMNQNDDNEMRGGACFVAVSLMSVNEHSHSILLDKTVATIELLLSGSLNPKLFGVERLRNLMQIFPEVGSEILKKFRTEINALFDLDDQQFTQIKQEAVMRLASIEMLNTDIEHPFISKIIEISNQWLSVDQPSFNGSAISALKNVSAVLPKETAMSIFAAFSDIAVNTKSMEVACRAIKAMKHALKFCTRQDVKQEIANIGYQTGILYIKGEMAVLDGVSPMGTDFDFDLLVEMSKMVRKLFEVPSEIMRVYFPFSCSIVERKNNLKTEITLLVWVSAIEHNALNPDEIEFAKKMALSLFVEDLAPELIYSATNLIISMCDTKYIQFSEIEEKIHVLYHWWSRCNEARHKMRTTMANIVLLCWKIAFLFNARSKIDDLIIKTFDQFPPDDVRRTAEMTSLLMNCFQNEPDPPLETCVKGSRSIMKLLIMPQIVLAKRKVTPDLISACKERLNLLRLKHPQIQNMINVFASKSASRQHIFTEFMT